MKNHEYVAELDGPQGWYGPGRKRYLAKGGGGGQAYYASAEDLYAAQADTAEFMLGLGKEYLPGATEGYFNASKDYFDPAYAARMAGEAGTTAQSTIDQSKGTMVRDMARYGVNPASGQWAGMNNANAMSGAALKAGSINAATRGVEDKRLGVAKDFYSSLVGMPSESAAAAGSAAAGYANMGAQADQRQANNASAMGNIAAMGYETFFAADGGEIRTDKRGETPLHRISKDIWDAGERHYAEGGIVRSRDPSTPDAANRDDDVQLDGSNPALKRIAKGLAGNKPAAPYGRTGSLWDPSTNRADFAPSDPNVSRLVANFDASRNAPAADGAQKMALGGLFKQQPAPQLAQTSAPTQPQQDPLLNRNTIKMAKLVKDGP